MKSQQNLTRDEKLGLGIHDPKFEVIYGEWGVFGDAWARLDPLKDHNCLQLYFSWYHFLDLSPENTDEHIPVAQDPLIPLAETFYNACEQLQAEVAFLDTRPHYGDEVWGK